jgi:hypothetical protein
MSHNRHKTSSGAVSDALDKSARICDVESVQVVTYGDSEEAVWGRAVRKSSETNVMIAEARGFFLSYMSSRGDTKVWDLQIKHEFVPASVRTTEVQQTLLSIGIPVVRSPTFRAIDDRDIQVVLVQCVR